MAGSLIFGGTAYNVERARPAMFGTVIGKEGSRLTISGKSGRERVTTTYTVEVSDAKISEGLGAGAVELDTQEVAIGDKVAVLGAIS